MAQDATQVQVAGDGHIYIAPVGTSLPTTLAALTGAWKELGYTTEDGVTFTVGRQTTDLGAWQSFDPVRVLVTSQTKQVAFTLRQTNPDNFAATLGGGVFTAGGSVGKYEFPDPNEIGVVALVVDALDGDNTFRYVFDRMQVTGDVVQQLQRGDSMNLAATFVALASATKPYVLSDADAFLS